MTRQEKIEFLLKRNGDKWTEPYLSLKPDIFIDHLYQVESEKDDRLLEEMLFHSF